MSVAASWAQRILRVWRVLPPPENFGAPSSTSTEAPVRRALIAAHNAALPPPITSTSNLRLRSTMPCCLSRLHGNKNQHWSKAICLLRHDLAWGRDGLLDSNGLAVAIDHEGGDDAKDGGAHQPESGRGAVAGVIDQPGRCERRECSEQARSQRKSHRETGGADMRRHYFDQRAQHGPAVDAEIEREHHFNRQHLAESWRGREPVQSGIGGYQ